MPLSTVQVALKQLTPYAPRIESRDLEEWVRADLRRFTSFKDSSSNICLENNVFMIVNFFFCAKYLIFIFK